MTHATIPAGDGGPRPRPIWDLLNEPRAIDPWTIRICCLVLAIAFGSIALLRAVSTGDFGFVLPRLAMMAYAVVGAVGGPHFSWRTLRAYTVGLTLMLPLTASYVIGTSGYQPSDIPFCALATAAPFLAQARPVCAAGVV